MLEKLTAVAKQKTDQALLGQQEKEEKKRLLEESAEKALQVALKVAEELKKMLGEISSLKAEVKAEKEMRSTSYYAPVMVLTGKASVRIELRYGNHDGRRWTFPVESDDKKSIKDIVEEICNEIDGDVNE